MRWKIAKCKKTDTAKQYQVQVTYYNRSWTRKQVYSEREWRNQVATGIYVKTSNEK